MRGLTRSSVLIAVVAASTAAAGLTACNPNFAAVSAAPEAPPAAATAPNIASANVRPAEAGGVGVTFQAVAASDSEDAVEFYHANFNHYFYTVNVAEMGLLDTGYFTGWARTGHKISVVKAGHNLAGTNPVCRFYGLPSAGLESHFFSASPAECAEVKVKFAGSWQLESDEAFRAILPNTATGVCPAGSKPIYRLFNNRRDSNHRYTTDIAVFNQMKALGHIAEGYGPVALPVAMCSPNSTGTTPPPTPPPGAFKLTCEEAKFLKLINMYRAQSGASALVASESATKAARWHSNDMGVKHYFGHTDSLGRDPYTRTSAFGFNYYWGENAAAGTSDANSTFCLWKNSPGHDENMRRSSFRSIGIGRETVSGSQYGTYWSTPFGSGSNDTIAEPVTDAPSCSMPSSVPGC